MVYPHTYFEDEIREGFYITGMMKRIWAAQLEVIEEIDRICKKHNIRWFADCGTLLGAVRHGGYIPWDDDLDICMLRPDYIRFNEVAEKELPEGYVVLNLHKEDHYFEYLTRVATGHRLNFDKEYLDKYHDVPYAIGIDIFPIDYVADDEEEEEQRKALTTMVMAAADEINEDNSNVPLYGETLAEIEELCSIKLDYSGCVKQQLYEAAEKLFSLYAYRGGKNVALMPYWIYFDNHLYPAEYFKNTLMMPFEFTKLPVPAAYDGVLRIEYGDYMKIYKGGGVHDYPFFTGQEEHLKKLVNPYPFEYVFNPKDLENNRVDREKPIEQARQLAQLMAEAHRAVTACLEAGRYDEVNSLLTACQNSAIQVGNMLEEHYGEGFAPVGVLEGYCELLYQVGELAARAGETGKALNVSEISACLSEITEAFGISAEQNISDRTEVLFLVYKSSHWKAFERIWRRYAEDDSCDVYVMPVPYYSRGAAGGAKEEFYDGGLYPDYVDITDYKLYDIERRRPDIIYIQEPYDGCNYTISTGPAYYSSHIKNYTEKLIYVPWFRVDEPEESNQKAKKTMDYYCRMPGVVNADVTMVQSEATRQAYIDYLSEFAGEDTRKIWEEKITVLPAPSEAERGREVDNDREQTLLTVPDNWKCRIYKDDGSRRKILLYNTNVAGMVQNGRAMLGKIKRNLDIFRENAEDVVLIWRPHPLIVQAIEATSPGLKKEYMNMVDEYRSEDWGIYDDTQDSGLAVRICDAYYGDSDGLAHECSTMGKPVMIQNVEC